MPAAAHHPRGGEGRRQEPSPQKGKASCGRVLFPDCQNPSGGLTELYSSSQPLYFVLLQKAPHYTHTLSLSHTLSAGTSLSVLPKKQCLSFSPLRIHMFAHLYQSHSIGREKHNNAMRACRKPWWLGGNHLYLGAFLLTTA